MKIVFLLFAVVFLVFQTQSEAVAKNEAKAQALDQVAQDEVMAKNGAAKFASPGQRLAIHCARELGVCRSKCSWREKTLGWCSHGVTCCKKRF